MDLIIVESPTKARTLSRFLGSGYQLEASMGHVRDLPEKRLGIDPEHDFAPEYVVSPDKKEKVKELQTAAAKAEKIILATDPDREGEAIAWHINEIITKKQETRNKIERITFHEITESAIKEALAHPGQINMPLVDAQQARRILDRLVGYKLSPLLWRKIRRGLSAGRVQSVAVRLIVEREREIQAFKPVEYWEILAKLQTPNSKFQSEFEAKLIKQEIKNKEEADKIVGELRGAQYQVTDIQSKEVKRNPYPPFTTSTMQQAASNLFGWSAKRTMQIAQNLYERGLITYHRTDSTNLAIEAVNAVRAYINKSFGERYLPETLRFYKTKSKVAQEAHEAIRPTNVERPEITEEGIDKEQKRLYELIWKRFVACQMAESLYKQSTVDVTAGNYTLRANGSKILFEGWQKLFGKSAQGGEEGDEETILPELSVGDILRLLGLTPSQHFTEPPARYTEASLIKALEEYGIGRPSTYAPIISTIQDRQYVEKEDKKLLPTALGMAVNDFLMANFANIMDYKFTAGMEDQLDEIANGEKQWVPVIREFYEPFNKQLGGVTETAARVKVEVETTEEKCPNDGAPLVVRIGRFGKFLACSKFPDCKFTKPYAKITGIKCPKCGGDVIMKRTKKKKSFYGCSNYPKCDFASWTKPKTENQTPVSVGK
ncbi:type I DNA topoisomerase [Patescibacteria group bacterium]|nr:type I DNA topoisomerase [Patescibacteria group bacterium]